MATIMGGARSAILAEVLALANRKLAQGAGSRPLGESRDLADAADVAEMAGLEELAGTCRLLSKAASTAFEETRPVCEALLRTLAAYCEKGATEGAAEYVDLAIAYRRLGAALCAGPETTDYFLPAVPLWSRGFVVPPHVSAPDAELVAAREAACFQTALKRYLTGDTRAALDGMRSAFLAVENRNPHVGLRAFLACAICVLDQMLAGASVSGVPATKIFAGLHKGLKDIAAGATRARLGIAINLLAVVAGAPTGSARARAIHAGLRLTLLASNTPGFADALARARRQIDSLSEQWTRQWRTQTLSGIATDVGHIVDFGRARGLQELVDVAVATRDFVREAAVRPVRPESLGMAGYTAFAVLDSLLVDPHEHDSPATVEQVRRMCADAFKGVVTGEFENASIVREARSRSLAAARQGVSEIEARLGETAAGVSSESVAVAAAACEEVGSLMLLLGEEAAHALAERLLAQLRSNCGSPDALLSAIAEDFARLSQFVALLEEDPGGARGLLATIPRAPRTDAHTPKGGEDRAHDPDVLEIFAEEVRVLAPEIEAGIADARQGRRSGEAQSLRRYFHTLKGSGRMALVAVDAMVPSHVAEIAWHTERAFNGYETLGLAVDAPLLELAADARAAFLAALDEIATQGVAQVTWGSFEARADALLRTPGEGPIVDQTGTAGACAELSRPHESSSAEAIHQEEGEFSDTGVFAAVHFAPPAPAAAAASVAATEGTSAHDDNGMVALEGSPAPAIAAWLFSSYCDESRRLVADLIANDVPKIAHGVAEFELMRKAHTLASISEACGLQAICDLGRAMESVVETFQRHTIPLEPAAIMLLEVSSAALERMANAVWERRWPAPREDLVQRLQSVVEKAVASEAPPAAAVVVEPEAASMPVETDVAPENLGAPPADDMSQEPPPDETSGAEAAKNPRDAGQQPQEPRMFEDTRAGAIESPPRDVAEPEAAVTFQTSDDHAVPVSIRDDFDETVRVAFLDEARVIMPDLVRLTGKWTAGDRSSGNDVRRLLHTLKGSARMAGALRFGYLTHRAEELLGSDALLSPAASSRLLATLDTLADALDRGGALEAMECDSSAGAVHEVQDMSRAAPQSADTLRVRAASIRELLQRADEAIVLERRGSAVGNLLRAQVAGFADGVTRLRDLTRLVEIEAESQIKASDHEGGAASTFDPLQFDRYTRLQEHVKMVQEAVTDIELGRAKIADAARMILENDERRRPVSEDIRYFASESLFGMLDVLVPRMERVVRQAGAESGKAARLEASLHVEVHNRILDGLVVPLEHILRNAIAHGIEAPDDRAQTGKPGEGVIRVTARQEGTMVVVSVADDGAGISAEKVRARAVQRDILSAAGAAALTEEEVMGVIFQPGFSTADEASQLAGRGVGLDAAKGAVEALGGELTVSSGSGAGATFTIRVPVDASLVSVAPVLAGSARFMIPTSIVERFTLLDRQAAITARAAKAITLEGRSYGYRTLADCANLPRTEPRHFVEVVVLRGEPRHVVEIDGHHNADRVLVKAVGSHIAQVPGILGTTISAEGEPVLLVNPGAMVVAGETAADVRVESRALLGLIVDDSQTVRTLSARFLKKNGYDAETARDGQDAVDRLVTLNPDFILLDLEMPRMDGFEFARIAKGNSTWRHIPIIVISSRSAERYQAEAKAIGIERMLGKPYKEDDLLETIRELTQAPGRKAGEATAACELAELH